MEQINIDNGMDVVGCGNVVEIEVPSDVQTKKVRKARTKAAHAVPETVNETISDITQKVSKIQIENKPKKRIVSAVEPIPIIPWPVNLENTNTMEQLEHLLSYEISFELKTMLQEYNQIISEGVYDIMRLQVLFTSLLQYYRRLVAILIYNQNKNHNTITDCIGLKTFFDTMCYKNRLVLESGNISCTMKSSQISTIHNMKNVGDLCFFQDLPAMKSVEENQPNISSIVTDLYVIWCLHFINIIIIANSDYNESLVPSKTTKAKDGTMSESKKDLRKMFIEKILLLASDTAQPATKALFGVIVRKKKVTPKAGAVNTSISDALTTATIQNMIGRVLEDSEDVLILDDESETEMAEE